MASLDKSWAIGVLAALAPLATTAQQPPRNFSAEIDAAVQAAKTAAGFDHLGALNRLCVLPPSFGPPSTADEVPAYVSDPSRAPARDTWYADAAQVFDDLYWLGGSQHSAWLLTTSAGHILIDTEYPYNSEVLILDGMRKLGLDPKDVRYIVISHAHADHIGGVELVQRASGATVVMGAADWDLVSRFPNRYRSMTPDPVKGIRVREATTLTLGDRSIRIHPTPGHTEGTLSYIFTVHDFGRPVVVAYSGGTAFNFQTDLPNPGIANLDQYIESQRTFAAAAAEAGASVLLSNHSEFDVAHDKSRMIAGRGFGPNPFVSSAAEVQRYFEVLMSCARAKRIGLERVAAEASR